MRFSKYHYRYFNSAAEFDQYQKQLKFVPCPHCGKSGCLICHGYLRGYGQSGNEQVIRGHRFFCSNRYRKSGCGKTFSILSSNFLRRHIVPASTLWKFLQKVRNGLSRHAAWYQVGSPFSIKTGYGLWRKIKRRQTWIRTLLSRVKSPPLTDASEPVFQMIEHLYCVFPDVSCPITAFHMRFQRSFLQ